MKGEERGAIFTGGYPFSTLTFKQQLLEPEAERRDDAGILVDIMEACGFLPEIPEYLYDIAEEGVKNNDRMAIIQPVNKFIAEIGREDCRKPVLYKVMGKAMNSVSKAVFWTNFIYGELSIENAMRVGYACPHVHPELEYDPELMPLVIRDQVFFAIDHSPSGNVIAGAKGTIEGLIEDHVMHTDKKIHLFDETVDQYISAITPEAEAEAIALTKEYPYLISAGTHSDEAGVNTIMRNPESYAYRQPYVFEFNPEDAKEMNIADGQWVRVTTKTGSIKIPVQYTYRAARGYGKITHHFGLYNEEGKAYGEAVNMLTSAEDVDEIAGDTIYRYVPCRVEALEEGEEYGLWNHKK